MAIKKHRELTDLVFSGQDHHWLWWLLPLNNAAAAVYDVFGLCCGTVLHKQDRHGLFGTWLQEWERVSFRNSQCVWGLPVAETVCCTTMAMVTISRMWIWVLTKDEVRHPVALSSMLVPSHEAVLSHTWSRLISMLHMHILTRPFKFIYTYSFSRKYLAIKIQPLPWGASMVSLTGTRLGWMWRPAK